jgi:YVTN family beta-propeller protein
MRIERKEGSPFRGTGGSCAWPAASDYVAIVSVETMTLVSIIPVDDAPGWAETGPDGSSCYVASTRANTVSVISYESFSLVAEIPTGAGPKYLASAHIPAAGYHLPDDISHVAVRR